MDKAFVDTNILVYLYFGDPQKHKKAYLALRDYECYISVQVAMEFCSVCTRKLRYTPEEARNALSEIRQHCLMSAVTGTTIDRALDVQARYGFSFYDSVMIASALEHGCRYLFSEDLRHRQRIGKTMIYNIFAA